MSKSRRSSITSVPCRLEWRPSRQVGAALWYLALLAPFCLLASDLPRGWAWPLAVLAGLVGIRDAWRHRHQPTCQWVIPAGRGAPTCDAEVAQQALVQQACLGHDLVRGDGVGHILDRDVAGDSAYAQAIAHEEHEHFAVTAGEVLQEP